MALITCPECGKQMSDKAAACPHCGCPVSAPSAAEERKCAECGAVLPDGAAACPTCGCPVEESPVRQAPPAPPVRPPQATEPVTLARPANVQLGSAKARIEQMVSEKTAAANVWFFIAIAVSMVLYLIAFSKYMKFIGKVDELKNMGAVGVTAGDVAASLSDKAKEFINMVGALKWLLIGALVIAGIAVIFDLVKMSKKELMSKCAYMPFLLAFAGFWIPQMMMSEFFKADNSLIKEALDFLTKDDFGTYINVCPIVMIVLGVISWIVDVTCPKKSNFCQSCGAKLSKGSVTSLCPECGEKTYLLGFSPVPRDVVNAYPYSGETLVGISPVRGGEIVGIVLVDMLSILIGALYGLIWSDGMKNLLFFIVPILLGIIISILVTVIRCKKGIREKVTVTPTSVKINGCSVSISEITEVLSNESGCLAICTKHGAFTFTDISSRAQIAAALAALTSKR